MFVCTFVLLITTTEPPKNPQRWTVPFITCLYYSPTTCISIVIRYKHHRDALEKTPKIPWGTAREYGGEGPVNLPEEHRPKNEPPPAVEKGHRHYGTGTDPYPR